MPSSPKEQPFEHDPKRDTIYVAKDAAYTIRDGVCVDIRDASGHEKDPNHIKGKRLVGAAKFSPDKSHPEQVESAEIGTNLLFEEDANGMQAHSGPVLEIKAPNAEDAE